MRGRLQRLISPLRTRACRSLFGAQLVSGLGDWAGRLALAVLVYDRSESAAWAAAITVVSLLPWLGPGQLLATFADRFGRIRVMVASDIVRAALFAVMIIPQPNWLLLVWAFAAGVCVPPFVGARSSAMVEVAPPEQYQPSLALYGVLSQAEILIGYAVGGLVIASLGARTALAANAVTFLISALILRDLRSTSAATPNDRSPVGWAGVRSGVAVWRSDPLCKAALVLFVGVSMFMVLPEALVVPMAAELDVPTSFVGVLAALVAVGAMAGMLAVPVAGSHVDLLRATATRAAVVAGVAGVLFAGGVVPVVAGLAYLVSGVADAAAVPTNQVVGERLPKEGRAAAMAVAGGLLYLAQAVTVLTAGVIATVSSTRVPLVGGMFLAAGVCVWSILHLRTIGQHADPTPVSA